jgi:succinoglycan biosynthesis transport protein ExoP
MAKHSQILQRGWKWVVVCGLAGGAAGFGLARLVPAKYTSTARLESATSGGLPVSMSAVTAMAQQALSQQALQGMVEHFAIYPPGSQKPPVADQVVEMHRNIELEPRGTGFAISFTNGNADVARQVSGELARLLVVESKPSVGSRPGGPAQQFAADQVKDAKRHRDESDLRLAEFGRKHAAELAGAYSGEAQRRLADYNRQLQATDAALKSAQGKRAALTEALFTQQPGPPKGRKPGETPNTDALEQELATKRAELVTLQARYTPDHPDVVKVKTDIGNLQKKIDEAKQVGAASGTSKPDAAAGAAATDAGQIQAQMRELDKQIDEKTRDRDRLQQDIQTAQAKLETSPVLGIEYSELKNEADSAKDAYDRWIAKQNDLQKEFEAEEQKQQPTLALAGQPDVARTFPNPGLFALGGTGCGLVLGVFVAAWTGLSDKTLRTESDVERLLDLPTLAVIPVADMSGGDRRSNPGSWGDLGKHGEKEEGVLTDV